MRMTTIALATWVIGSTLPNPASAAAPGESEAVPVAPITAPPGSFRLAGSFQNSTAKLADKYLAGRSGGRLGIGGTESVVFKKKKSK
jgi:hypothetical protein